MECLSSNKRHENTTCEKVNRYNGHRHLFQRMTRLPADEGKEMVCIYDCEDYQNHMSEIVPFHSFHLDRKTTDPLMIPLLNVDVHGMMHGVTRN